MKEKQKKEPKKPVRTEITEKGELVDNADISITDVKHLKAKGRKIKPMLNLNQLILGGSGTGKSRYYVKPNLMQCNTSYVVTDPSGELLQSCGKMLERMGYKIKVFNINDMKHSSNYNPFHYLKGYDGKINNNNVIKMINVFMMNTKGEGQSGDPFWDDATRLLLSSVCFLLVETATEEEQNFATVLDLIHKASPTPVNIKVSAGTIVINTCSVNRDYAGFYIFHECIHNELHYLFFRLQQMGSNDPRKMKTQKIEIDDDDDEKDEMFFIENQANRGAYGLIMPYSHIKKLIDEEAAMVTGFRHEGERYDKVMKNISQKICQPHFMVRIRMVQLGYIKAKGSSQTVNGEDVPPFDFDIDSWRDSRHTYVIDETTVTALCGVNKGLNRLIKKGYYVCAEGHVVRNIPRFVETRYDKHFLTDFANAHVDDCCLRFVKIYRRGNAGRTAIDHMYYDEDYLRQTAFYLSDIKNKAQLEGQELDDFDAKRLFLQEFPTNFKDAVDKLRELNDMSLDKMAELISMDRKTMTRWLEDSRKYRNEDFLTILCLIFKLPDWLSMVLFKRAHFMLDEEDKRHEAILHILRVQTEDGIEAANDYLCKNHLSPLTVEG